MVIDPSMLAEVLGHLASSTMSIAEAKVDVPPRPGLYAVHGDTAVWRELGLGEPTDARPLYVGKAERSLASRDVDTHFSTGRTGSSTLRRSLAGLLADQLALKGHPRNPAKPERFYASVDSGVYRTEDGGRTWSPHNTGIKAYFVPDPWPEFGQCVHKVAAHPDRPDLARDRREPLRRDRGGGGRVVHR